MIRAMRDGKRLVDEPHATIMSTRPDEPELRASTLLQNLQLEFQWELQDRKSPIRAPVSEKSFTMQSTDARVSF